MGASARPIPMEAGGYNSPTLRCQFFATMPNQKHRKNMQKEYNIKAAFSTVIHLCNYLSAYVYNKVASWKQTKLSENDT